MGVQYFLESVCAGLLGRRSRARSLGIAIVKTFDVSGTCNSASEIVVHWLRGSRMRGLRNQFRRPDPFSVISPSYTDHKSASIYLRNHDHSLSTKAEYDRTKGAFIYRKGCDQPQIRVQALAALPEALGCPAPPSLRSTGRVPREVRGRRSGRVRMSRNTGHHEFDVFGVGGSNRN
jgi:hypothetical protein